MAKLGFSQEWTTTLQRVERLEIEIESRILLMVETFQDDVHSLINCLPLSARHTLRELLVRYLKCVGRVTYPFSCILRSLPIWPTLEGDDNLLSGVNAMLVARMVPYDVPPDVPYVKDKSVLLRYDYTLMSILGVYTLTFDAFCDHLDLPKSLTDDADFLQYRRILELFIPRVYRDVLVPNGSGDIVNARSLHARSQPLFLHAFKTRPSNLVHEKFEDLEHRLIRFGLNLTVKFSAFEECARAIHEDVDGVSRPERAAYVFQWYSDYLYLEIKRGEGYWSQLDRLRFIPRDSVRRRSPDFTLLSTYCREFPEVVSPNEILLQNHEAICWTQRALSLIPPSYQLLASNAHFGAPLVKEVIEHLRILATEVAIDHPGNLGVLSDLTQTYAWLEKDASSEFPSLDLTHLAALKNVALFLNVDEPTSTEWTFKCAELLLFDPPDTFDVDSEPASNDDLDIVCTYLWPFRNLLHCAGLPEFKYPDQPYPYEPSPYQQLPLLSNVGMLRRDGKLADVVFFSRTGEKIPAHRLMCLATGSDYFQGLFLGGFRESRHASVENPVHVVLNYFSTHCLNSVLDHIYEGTFPTSQPSMDDLCEILQCAHYWQLLELFEATQHLLIDKVKLDWNDFQYLGQVAEATGATILRNYCNAFETANFNILEKLQIVPI